MCELYLNKTEIKKNLLQSYSNHKQGGTGIKTDI